MGAFSFVGKVITKIFGSRNDRLIKAYRRRVEMINVLEPEIRAMSDEQLKARVAELRKLIASGTRAGDVMYEGLAIMRESLDRNVGIRNIFHPDHRGNFAADKLPPQARAMYDQALAKLEQTPPGEALGHERPVDPWLEVEVPVELYEAVRVIYPVSRPPFRSRPFDVQLIGGMVLYDGRISEMKTGEGKTIVAPLACFMAAISGYQTHVVTVNDYLVQRDRDWVFPAFHKLGITAGAIHPFHMQDPDLKKQAYQCDIVYGTNSEFGFDYLRDNMKLTTQEQVQRRRDFCIVDEIDSILIDEARTPLIISGPAHDDAPKYRESNAVAEQLVAIQKTSNARTAQAILQPGFAASAAQQWRVPQAAIEKIIGKFTDLGPDFLDEKEAEKIGHIQYYVVKREEKSAHMTHLGVAEAQKIAGARFYVAGNDMSWDHLITNALRAHTVYEIDREYVVDEGEVVIIDEFTGRKMIGRQWSDGLHQAVEAKESRRGVQIKQETQTLATITIQNYFKLYRRLAGMTGTALTEAMEFQEIYKLEVVTIPTNVPVVRGDMDDLIFLNGKAKWNAIIEDIKEKSDAGRPVLVGTTSVEKSEVLSRLLTQKHHIEHEVLNAKQHEREASIVAKAGQTHVNRFSKEVGNVTIATNMAGRGTDIKLPESVRTAGGLHIIGTERHEARRIDNQLRGRAGRQGDPGSSRFFISMEDDLMKLFAGKATMKALSMLGMKDDDALEHRWITRSVERAQRKVEERNFQIRKNLLEYDEVMEYQRNTFYGTRQAVLEGKQVKQVVFSYITQTIEDAVAHFLDRDFIPNQLAEAVKSIFNVVVDPKKLRAHRLKDIEPLIYNHAKNDARMEIENTLGEYVLDLGEGEEAEPGSGGLDYKELSAWAQSRFGVELSAAKMKELDSEQLANTLYEAADAQIDKKSIESLEAFFTPTYASEQLAAWANQKFGMEIKPEEVAVSATERPDKALERVGDLIYHKALDLYHEREIVYPVQYTLEMAIASAQKSYDSGAWVAEQLVRWVNWKFDFGWTTANIAPPNTGEDIFNNLADEAEAWHKHKLKEWVDKALEGGPSDAEISERVLKRWGVKLTAELLAEPDRHAMLMDQGYQVLRAELTQLEQFVMLQILDSAWKDHLYAIDQLKDSIGLRSFAEKDPKIEYKKEGSRMFQEMLRSVRLQVTDLIFRAKLSPGTEMRDHYANQQAHHYVPESTGVQVGQTAEQQADQAAAELAGQSDEPVQPIVNAEPKVGRNDLCPCGSGKKYKKCCGVGVES